MEPNPASDPQTSRPHRELQLPTSTDPDRRELLERVLRETVGAGMMGGLPPAAEVGALLEVARRHRGAEFSLEPVAVELVAAALKEPFERAVVSPQDWQAMTRQIAQLLCDDPAAGPRLAQLWAWLGEQVK